MRADVVGGVQVEMSEAGNQGSSTGDHVRARRSFGVSRIVVELRLFELCELGF
jgi:hypothetical protein